MTEHQNPAVAGRRDTDPNADPGFAGEVERGDRFLFGENWARFLELLDEDRIRQAELSFEEMLGVESISGRTFVDIGSGSGLFSLAAMRLGAARVHSLDFDPASVACTRELKRRYFPDSAAWTVEQASVLDAEHLRSLGTFDIVYSWGVLHHTGAMWDAIGNAASLVAPDGDLFIAIYNDQGRRSARWRRIKRRYNAVPRALRPAYAAAAIAPQELVSAARATLSGRPGSYIRAWTRYRESRGMSRWRDIVDWVGGYPFEVAKPEAVFTHVHNLGFELRKLVTVSGHGCNQFVFAQTGRKEAG